MTAFIDITGERYGLLTAIRRVHTTGQGAYWLFSCDCGRESRARLKDVRFGNTLSCGCLKNAPGAPYGQPKIMASRPWRTAQTWVDKYAKLCSRFYIAVPGVKP